MSPFAYRYRSRQSSTTSGSFLTPHLNIPNTEYRTAIYSFLPFPPQRLEITRNNLTQRVVGCGLQDCVDERTDPFPTLPCHKTPSIVLCIPRTSSSGHYFSLPRVSAATMVGKLTHTLIIIRKMILRRLAYREIFFGFIDGVWNSTYVRPGP